ncbi:MAG: hypothetical protein GY845_16790 [Planctomycetes bacterium]|nr:hypothetical protein [Planctomycetota bacterium]
MVSLDREKMSEIVREIFIVAISNAYGNEGIAVLQEVMKKLRQLYNYITPERIKGTLVVFQQLEDAQVFEGLSKPLTFTNLNYLAREYEPATRLGTTLIQVQPDGTFNFWKDTPIDLENLAQNAIVYLYQNEQESFIVNGSPQKIPNPDGTRTYVSVFARPTFRSLAKALDAYKWKIVSGSGCEILSHAWFGGKKSHRLCFVNDKPEAIMRKSLTQYLKHVLRGADVQPEVNVDESHPVDIQVAWMFTNRLAIIEIKWMGNSLNATGDKFTAKHRDFRAREGARQLAEYLDSKHTWAPLKEVIGYLVVIDARRKGIKVSDTCIDRENGFWYKDREVEFEPEYHKIRPDFSEPIRMFAEPICRPD